MGHEYTKPENPIRRYEGFVEVPPGLNRSDVYISLAGVEHEAVALLFRDMKMGDNLPSQRETEQRRLLLERIISLGDAEFHAMLQRQPQLNKDSQE